MAGGAGGVAGAVKAVGAGGHILVHASAYHTSVINKVLLA